MDEAWKELTPTGALRAAINIGNPVLAKAGADGGDPTGVSVDLAREIGRLLDRPVTLTAFETAGRIFDALDQDAWDVAFLANEPERAGKIAFTDPYVIIEGTYLVRADAPYRSAAELDRPGLRVASCLNAAYDLYLSRTLKHAERVLSGTSALSIAQFRAEGLDAAAGVRQALEAFAADKPDLRVLPDRFMAIGQAIAAPQGRPAAAEYLRRFGEEAKKSGLIRRTLDRHGHQNLAVAP